MECKLENVVHFKNGKKKPNSKGNIPIYGGNGILGYTDKYNAFNNSIIIGRVGAYCGCVYKCENECWVSDNAILGQVKENYDYMYVYYLMKTLNIHDLHVGSGQPLMTQDILNNIIVNIPCYKEQVKIGKFLNEVDKKIELNNQINNNLHKLANELFNSWFVDFNYPDSNEKMKKTSLGLIPEDWHVSKLSDIAECQNGYAFYKDGYDENGTMVIDLGNINLNGTFIYTNVDKFIDEERIRAEKFNKYRVYKNDLIMVMTDRKATMELLGKTGKVYENKEFLLNQRMYRIRSKINTNYLYTALNSSYTLNKLKSKALGSVQKYVNTGDINDLELIIGTNEIMEKFSNIVDPIYSEIENRTVENTNLENLRDILLPKLMNGEIDLDKIEI